MVALGAIVGNEEPGLFAEVPVLGKLDSLYGIRCSVGLINIF